MPNTIKIERIAVLGAGVMGAQLAGLFANKGIRTSLFDISIDVSSSGRERLNTLKPPPLEKPENINLITPCCYENDMEKIEEADWIIEAVPENIDIKVSVYNKIASFIKPTAILSTNTSGITLKELIPNLPETLKDRFIITHFFNPPAYMKLLELIKTKHTSSDIYETMNGFAQNQLHKGIVPASDTPNFIGNRVGIFGIMSAIKLALEKGITIQEADMLTGKVCGRPNSATFRTADLIGLDILKNVANTTYKKSTHDESIEVFKIPNIIEDLIEKGNLGQKTNGGFYKKNEAGDIEVYHPENKNYAPIEKLDIDLDDDKINNGDINQRINYLISLDNKYGDFFWHSMSDMLLYCAHRIPEITSDPINIDNAMKWGFGWQLGPFEIWDIIGLPKSVDRMRSNNKKIPQWIKNKIISKELKFY